MPSPVAKKWHLLAHERSSVENLALSLGVAPVVAQLLLNRGIGELAVARRFLDAPLSGLHAPDLLPGVRAAADRIVAAVKAGRGVCIYGDYDVDGVTGSSILLQCLRLMGAQPELYLPLRLEEGYGLNREALQQIAASGVKLVVTVDCGIASVAEADEAKRLGLELIITDHHEFRDVLPDAAVLVHPRLPGSAYPFGHLCGAAVALKLAWAIAQRASGGDRVTPQFRKFLLDAVALAALGVVADVVPLHDENRIIVRHGLNRLRAEPSLGLSVLCASAGLTAGAELRASDIGFKLGPRINAAGRLGCARLCVDLLTATQQEKAEDLVRFLEDQNTKRQTLERRIVAEARERIDAEGRGGDHALVLCGPDWHPGVIGIVAGRLAEMYGKPTILIAQQQKSAVEAGQEGEQPAHGVGSGRSIIGYPLNEALAACGDLLLSHGGHRAAAGLRIDLANVDAFRERLCEHARRHFPDGTPIPTLVIDAETPLSIMTPSLLKDLDRLEPYGAENRKPLFLAGELQVEGEPRKVGKGERHLSFRVRQQGTAMKAIAWGMAERVDELLSEGGACSVVFTPKLNEWQGRRMVDLEVTDFQAGKRTRLS